MRSVAVSALLLLFMVSACSARALPSKAPPLASTRQATTTAETLLTPPSTAQPPTLSPRPTVVAAVSAGPTTLPTRDQPAALTATPLPYLGKDALQRWRRQLMAVRAGTPYAQATIALVGDSWVDGDVILGQPLRQALQAEYGDGGAGFVEFGGDSGAKGAPLGQNISYARSGSWTIHDLFSDPRGQGVDLADASSTDTSTPGTILISGEFNDVILHYIKQPGGGSFRWRVDSEPWRDVSTAGPDVALATERIGNLPAGRHTVKIIVSSAGNSGVRLAGADLRKQGNGVRVDRIGMNGAAALDFTMVDAGLWEAGLSALDPDLVILLLGTNDDARQRLPSQFRSDMVSILARIKTAVPQADVLLLAPGDNNLKATNQAPFGMDEYTAQLRALAAERHLAFLDSSKVLGSFASANAKGLYYDDVHINENGGKLLAGYLLENLLELRTVR